MTITIVLKRICLRIYIYIYIYIYICLPIYMYIFSFYLIKEVRFSSWTRLQLGWILVFYFIRKFRFPLPSSSRISTTVWLHHIDSNTTPTEEDRCELHKNAARCFEEILEAAFYKKNPAVRTLTVCLANHPSKIC